jgi:hypothetical protein
VEVCGAILEGAREKPSKLQIALKDYDSQRDKRMMDNGALYDICRRNLDIERP